MTEYIFNTEEEIVSPCVKLKELIRCKDCLFNDGNGPNEEGKYWCAIYQAFMQYCSEAERRES